MTKTEAKRIIANLDNERAGDVVIACQTIMDSVESVHDLMRRMKRFVRIHGLTKHSRKQKYSYPRFYVMDYFFRYDPRITTEHLSIVFDLHRRGIHNGIEKHRTYTNYHDEVYQQLTKDIAQKVKSIFPRRQS